MNLRLILIVLLCLTQTSVTPVQPGEDKLQWEHEAARLASILKTLSSDFDRTTFLRVYTGQLISIGLLDDQTKQFYQSMDFDSFSLSAFYARLKKDNLPAECGITTYFYIKLLQAFGFKAYQYSFGFKDKPYQRFIHSIALVEINFHGAKRLIIQDPYLNLTYRNKKREPIDFFEFLSLIKQKRYGDIVMDPASLATFLVAPDLSLYDSHLNDSCKKLMHQAFREDTGSFKTKIVIARDYVTLMQSPCDPFEQGFVSALHEHGYEEPFIYAYALRASELVGNADHAQVQRQIDSIIR